MDEQSVTFSVVRTQHEKRWQLEVNPSLTSILCGNNGEYILSAIAANCVRMLAKRDGLEGAVDRVTAATTGGPGPIRISGQSVTFKVVTTRDEKGLHFKVSPSLTNMVRSNGAESVLAGVAANCIRCLARRNGLEGAIERVTVAAICESRVVS